MDWYYAEGGQQRGPVSEAELDNLVVAGTIRHDTLVWCEGMAEWQTFGQVKSAGSPGPAAPPAMGSIVCWQCGKTFAPDEVVRIGEGWVCAACKPLYVQRLKEGAAVSGALDYAGFWIRFAAKFIDSLVLGVLVIVPIFVFGFVMAYRAARAHGKWMGVGGVREDLEFQTWLIQIGLRYLTGGSDVGYILSAGRADVKRLREVPLS